MKVMISGMNGTVAPVLAKTLVAAGSTVVPWDRSRVPTDDREAIGDYIHSAHPAWFFHLATGSPDWAEAVAEICAQKNIRFLFTSSVSVFSASQKGPFTIEQPPQPADDYGKYKLECETRIRTANSKALVVRLGWQIGEAPGSNQMVDYLDRTFRSQGQLVASTNWYQACSFLDDTAVSLMSIMKDLPCGLYHLDGNPGLSFYEIVLGLNRMLGEPWIVTPSDSPVQNNLMQDEHVQVSPITQRFLALLKNDQSVFPEKNFR
jgi:dTDP-4-dehydrorhamnose reductase